MWLWFIITTLVVFICYKLSKLKALGLYKEDKIVLQKPDFKKDIVYLVQFPISPTIRTISPFALKLETYLRLKKVPYECVYSFKFSKKGQIPYIELNGEQIADSNIIIQELENRGIAKSDEEISSTQQAMNHLATVTIENHTSLAGFHWRYGYNMPEFYEKLCEPYFGSGKSLLFFRYLQPYGMIMKTKMHGLGRHSLSEIAEFSFKDLEALSNLLGEKPYFNGNSPKTVDCTIFGHLVQFVYMPLDIPQKQYIKEKCPNLEEFVDRMKDNLWLDWEEMCNGSCMEGKRVAN